MLYLFLKCLHIVAIISWMAGILYLFRILIYHTERGLKSKDNHELLSLMAKKLYGIITFPAMCVSWLAALGMLSLNPTLLSGTWLHIKLFCVLLLSLATVYAGSLMKRFAAKDEGLPTGKYLRIFNEVPTILMMIIVAMVVFRPFS